MYLTATDTEIRKSATNHKKEKGLKYNILLFNRKSRCVMLIHMIVIPFILIIEINVDHNMINM